MNEFPQKDMEQMAALLQQMTRGHCTHYGAVALCKIAHELSRNGQQRPLETLLLLCWLQISHNMIEKMDKPPETMVLSAMFLERYFANRGDWNKIDEDITADFAKEHGTSELASMSAAIAEATTLALARHASALN